MRALPEATVQWTASSRGRGSPSARRELSTCKSGSPGPAPSLRLYKKHEREAYLCVSLEDFLWEILRKS